MDIILVLNTPAGKSVLIDSSIDNEADAKVFAGAIVGFDEMILCAGRFNVTDATYLTLNGRDLDHAMITNEDNLIEFLRGD